MTGQSLVEHLKNTGTGVAKLVKAIALLKAKPDAPATEVVDALRASGAAEGTLQKCEAFLGVALAVSDAGTKTVFPVRAPIGATTTVGGQQFVPGQIVPAELVAAATPDEIQSLCKESAAIGAAPTTTDAPPAGSPAADPGTPNPDAAASTITPPADPPAAPDAKPTSGKKK